MLFCCLGIIGNNIYAKGVIATNFAYVLRNRETSCREELSLINSEIVLHIIIKLIQNSFNGEIIAAIAFLFTLKINLSRC